MKKPPVFFWLFVACVALHAFGSSQLKDFLAFHSTDYVDGAGSLLLATLRLFSYQFVHANWSHVIGNFCFMAAPALYLEDRLGAKKFLLFYLLSGVISALCFLMAFSCSFAGLFGSPFGLIGASGSASGVLVYALLLYGKERWWKAAICAVVGLNFFLPQFTDALLSQLAPAPVAYWGHVGGAMAAFILAQFILPKPLLHPRKAR